MKTHELLHGELVQLISVEPEQHAAFFSRWSHNGEYMRNLDGDPIRLWSPQGTQKWLKDETSADKPNMILFMIQELATEQVIGFVDLSAFQSVHRNAWVGIGLGEPSYWGRGYGTDAMRTLLRYAFSELGLHRVTLTVFEYNERAIRSYQKVGFMAEGRYREFIHRDGRRWDMIFMGILREEWEHIKASNR